MRRTTRWAAGLAACLSLAGWGASERPAAPVGHVSAESAGFDPSALRDADRRFRELPDLLSVLAMRNGRLAFERYYRGADATTAGDVFSVTKSVVSMLVGIALRDGRLRSVDQRLVDFFPGELEPGTDPRVRRITLRDLLTMTAGYRETPIVSTDDWVRTLLNRPVVTDPGTSFSYDDGSAHLLSAVLTRATGKSASELAARELFAPLGILRTRWGSDGQGRSLGSTGLFLRPRDLLRLGRLYLERGRWHGRQLVPASWVRRSTTRQASVPGGYAYGYLWWVNTGPSRGFLAQGYGGQVLAVFPRLDLVVVVTGSGSGDRTEVLRRLVAAVRKR